jgi:hypothetical protein
VLGALGVPHYDTYLQEKSPKMNYYYYEFYKDLADRNERPKAEILADFADCFMSSCNDDCLRGTNPDLRACTDIIPQMREPGQSVRTTASPGQATETPTTASPIAETPRMKGLKNVMRSCWTRGGGMCSEECLAVSNGTWTCLENVGSCKRFMEYFTAQLKDDEQTCLTDLRTTPTTAEPELPPIVTQIWKTPVFRQVLLAEGPISAAYLVERMCSTLSNQAECERESICSWQMIRRASANLYTCAVDDHKVFFNADALDEVLSVSEELERVCYFYGFEGVCTVECQQAEMSSAQALSIAGLLFFLVSG